jgi:UDP:flavonoid glycosyltransferase YjiC (YdhE family)
MLSEAARDDLACAGARIEDAPVDLSQVLPACRLVVHLGGSGLAAEALLAGVPQLVLVTHVEQHLTGIALERAGIGRCFTAFDPASSLPSSAIADLLDDEAMDRRAADTGSQHRAARVSGAAFDAFDRMCSRLLG